jgi:hypothetical protein
MLIDVVAVRALAGHRVHLRFADGLEGEVDLDTVIRWEGLFAPLAANERFAEVRVDPELGTIVWPNGADIDPDVLYAAVKGRTIDLPRAATR